MSPRPKLSHLRKPQIIEAARRTIYERGFAETRISDIADRAGTSAASILYYFESKEKLLEEALGYGDETFYQRLRDEIAGLHSATEQLLCIIERCSRPPDPLEDWTLWLEMWPLVRHRPQLREAYERLERTGQQAMIEEVIRRGQRSGEFDPDADANDVSTMLSALIDALGVQVTLGHPTMSSERMRRLCLAAAARELGFTLPADSDDGAPAPVRSLAARRSGAAPLRQRARRSHTPPGQSGSTRSASAGSSTLTGDP